MSDSIRICVQKNCTNRLPKLKYDGHTQCVSYIGQDCDLEARCEECKDWSSETVLAVLKHRRKLLQDRARKAAKKVCLKDEGKKDLALLSSSSSALSILPLSDLSLLSEKQSLMEKVFGSSPSSSHSSSNFVPSVPSPKPSNSPSDQAMT